LRKLNSSRVNATSLWRRSKSSKWVTKSPHLISAHRHSLIMLPLLWLIVSMQSSLAASYTSMSEIGQATFRMFVLFSGMAPNPPGIAGICSVCLILEAFREWGSQKADG
jgi:hypothetical protein